MNYISTRGKTVPMQFSDVLLMGLAPDGGLMLPEEYPQIDEATLTQWRTLSYPELAFEIMQLFATDIPKDDLKTLIDKTYTVQAFPISPLFVHSKMASKSSSYQTVQHWHLKISPCSFWAMLLNMC